jgi:hypothetical protein
MNDRSVKILSAAALAFCCSGFSLPAAAAPGLGVGACVNVSHQPGPAKIIAVTPGGYVVQPEGKAASDAMNWAQSDVDAGPCPSAAATAALLAQPHSCFASDPDSKGTTAAERGFRGIIRRTLEHAAAPGMDGAVTVHFRSFKVGAPRRWMVSDGFNISSDQSKPIYGLRVAYTTCTDFRTQLLMHKQERNFECFTGPTGDAVCQTSGNSGGMEQDSSQYISK